MDDEQRRIWERELDDDWAQAQFEEASQALGPPDPAMPLIETAAQVQYVSVEELAALVGIWMQAAGVWWRRALAVEAEFERWRRQWYWRLGIACILILVLFWCRR
jgi:hypothetical protein